MVHEDHKKNRLYKRTKKSWLSTNVFECECGSLIMQTFEEVNEAKKNDK